MSWTLLFPSNQLNDAGYEDLLDLAFDGSNSFNVDLLTSASQVVSVSGYSQQQVTAWTTSTEADSVEVSTLLREITQLRSAITELTKVFPSLD